MKKKQQQTSTGNGHASGTIRLELLNPAAACVCIAGTFNQWRPEVTRMILLGGGRWVKELVLPSGIYEYRFVVDGQWMADPQAAESVPNPFGESNSVLRV